VRAGWGDQEFKRFSATITTVYNPTHFEVVLNCSGEANQAKEGRAMPCSGKVQLNTVLNLSAVNKMHDVLKFQHRGLDKLCFV